MNNKDYLTKSNWIKEYIENMTTFNAVDILDESFVDAYIEVFSPDYECVWYGAFKCKEIGYILSRMYKDGILDRHTRGVGCGRCHDGFPRWVYMYWVKNSR